MTTERPIGTWAFAGVAVASLGGPLALAALIVPSVSEDAISSTGLAVLASAVVLVALVIWLRDVGYLRGGADPTRPGAAGGLYTFVLEAAGRRPALAQAAVWTLSYLELTRVSLTALWTSQLIVSAVFPRFAARRGPRAAPAWGLSAVARALAGYGLYLGIANPAS